MPLKILYATTKKRSHMPQLKKKKTSSHNEDLVQPNKYILKKKVSEELSTGRETRVSFSMISRRKN